MNQHHQTHQEDSKDSLIVQQQVQHQQDLMEQHQQQQEMQQDDEVRTTKQQRSSQKDLNLEFRMVVIISSVPAIISCLLNALASYPIEFEFYNDKPFLPLGEHYYRNSRSKKFPTNASSEDDGN